VEIFPREGLTLGLAAYEGWLNSLIEPATILKERFVESPLAHPAALIRASALAEVSGWSEEPWPEDYALWLELMDRGKLLANAPRVLLRWRDHPRRLTRTSPSYSPAAFARLKARYLVRGPLAKRRCILWGAGKTGRLFHRELTRLGVGVERFVDVDPAKIGRTLHGAPVVGPDGLMPYRGVHLVAAVGAKGARALIRAHLLARGWVEVEEFTFVG